MKHILIVDDEEAVCWALQRALGREGHRVAVAASAEDAFTQVQRQRPDVIITHDPFRPYALHPDHRAVGLATTDAVYPTARDPLYFPEHLQEGLEPHKTAEIWFFGPEHPDKLVDITDTFDRKIHALRAHVTQVGDGVELEPRMRDRARELAEGHPFELAEAFKVVQMRR